jgi:hypothetical protein
MKTTGIVRFLGSLTMALVVMLFLSGVQAYADDGPPWVTIEKVTFAGSGCPPGTVDVTPLEDLNDPGESLQLFELIFTDYILEVDKWSSASEKRKFCTIKVDLHFPPGWSFTVAAINYHVFAQLQQKVKATFQNSYHFVGASQTYYAPPIVKYGPIDTPFTFSDTFGIQDFVWSPCGEDRPLNIHTTLRIDNSRNKYGENVIGNDQIDGQFQTVCDFQLKWRRCEGY